MATLETPSADNRARVRAALARRAAARDDAARALRDALVPLLADHAEARGYTRVTLFGSLARGDFHPDRSDIDLLAEPACRDPFELAGLLTGRLRVPVHLIEVGRAPASLIEVVRREGLVVYGA